MILANLHGGFVALPVIVATAACGEAISGPWDDARRRNVTKFGLAMMVSIVAALANPYGFGLYRHVGQLLVSSGVTSLIDEYQSAPFGKPEARVLEMAVLALRGSAGGREPKGRAVSTGPSSRLASPGADVDS